MSELSSFLFARPSFWEGFARLLDFGSTLSEYNQCETGDEADAIALFMDWNAVGKDLWSVMRQSEAAGSETALNAVPAE